MSKTDVFVDPDYIFEFTEGKYNPPTYRKFYCGLLNKWELSDNVPILIQGGIGSKRFLRDVERNGEVFRSASYYSPTAGGEVSANDWNSFVDSVERRKIGIDSKVRVHGATYPGCPVNFAVQLYGHLKGEHFFKVRTRINRGPPLEEQRLLSLEKEGAFRNSGIRLGDVIKSTLYNPNLDPSPEFPHGRVPFQLIDEESKIEVANLKTFSELDLMNFYLSLLDS